MLGYAARGELLVEVGGDRAGLLVDRARKFNLELHFGAEREVEGVPGLCAGDLEQGRAAGAGEHPAGGALLGGVGRRDGCKFAVVDTFELTDGLSHLPLELLEFAALSCDRPGSAGRSHSLLLLGVGVGFIKRR